MPFPAPTAPSAHWIVDVARAAEWPGASRLTIGRDTRTADAWAAVLTHCAQTEDQLLTRIAAFHRIPIARWDGGSLRAANLVAPALAERHGVVALGIRGGHLVVATADPTDLRAEQELAFATGRRVRLELASPSAIRAAHDASGAPASEVSSDVTAPDAAAPPIVGLLNQIIGDGIRRGASDIHIEAGQRDGVIRVRIDGVMHDVLMLPTAVVTRVISRIKVMGRMNIADRLRPQDGRARIRYAGRSIDLRLSTVPTRDAEKAVIRILDGAAAKRMEDIGLPARELQRLRALMRHRDGMVIVTGPTGSGKTTTLYSALAELATGDVNVVTIEDPVEYELARITQIQIESRRGVTFAGALRAVLRQDPDVILVGEVRDAETAATAAHAARTGHLVLTTLHTNDAIGALTRLRDLGLDRGTIADAVRGVVAQRLLRRPCGHCGGQRPSTSCAVCAGTGYRGRVAVAEVLEITDTLRRVIAERGSLASILAQARAEGMRALRSVGLDAVYRGDTTLDEVERVIGRAPPVASEEEFAHLDEVVFRDADHDEREATLDPDHPHARAGQARERTA